MLNHDPLQKGQEVFLKQPLQIYGTVMGPIDFGSDGSEVYCVKLQPQTQYYRAEDLEPSQKPQFKPTARQDLLERAQEMRGRIARRAHELFQSRGSLHGHDREDWIRAQSEMLRDVPVDIREGETDLAVQAEVPGFNVGTLEIQIEPLSLCLASINLREGQEGLFAGNGARDGQGEGNLVYSERRANPIFRVVDLPCPVDPQSVSFAFGDGILEIRVSKAAAVQETPGLAAAAAAD